MKRQYYSLMLVAMFAFLLLGQSTSAQSCSADFNAVIDGPDVAFDGIATGVSPSYVWDFGDGAYAYTENPEHTYDADGWYLICFYVYGADSCFASQCDTLAITGAGGAIAMLISVEKILATSFHLITSQHPEMLNLTGILEMAPLQLKTIQCTLMCLEHTQLV